MKKRKIIGIILARSNSKRLKNKNFLSIKNKMLIEYTIESALNSRIFSDIILSTDSNKYHEYLLKKYDLISPGIRPSYLADDLTRSEEVLDYVINWYENILKSNFDFFYLLQPTSPGRDSKEIINSVAKLDNKSLIGYSQDKITGATYIIKRSDFKKEIRIKDIPHDKYLSENPNKLIDIDDQKDFNKFLSLFVN